MRNPTSRRAVVALGIVAGVLVTAAPDAHADTTGPAATPWTIAGRPAPWSVTDLSRAIAPRAARETASSTTGARPAARTSRPSRKTSPPTPRVAGQRAPRTWTPSATCRATRNRVWTVGPGDTLWLIAGCYPDIAPTRQQAIDRIAARNGIRLPAGILRLGQRLTIPTAAAR